MTLSVPLGNGNKFKLEFKKLFFPLLMFVVVVFIFFKFSELKEIVRLFTQAKWYWLLAAFASQILNFYIQAKVYGSVFKILDCHYFQTRTLIKAGLAIYFLNYAIPSLGSAGHFFFMKYLRKKGVKEGKALVAILMEVLCYYSAFIILLIFSLFYLFFKLGSLGYSQIVAAVGFVLLMVLLSFILFFLFGNKLKANKRITWLAQKIDYYEDGIHQQERVDQLLNDFYQDFNWLKDNKVKILKPAGLQLLKFLTDGLTIFLIFCSFNTLVPLGLGVIAFAFGRLFGMVSFLPGGVGAFEGAMVLIFNSLGQPLELALSVMLVYRFFSFWLYFPLGLIAYKQLNVDKK